jgi:large-conductance mechanosensitive channel
MHIKQFYTFLKDNQIVSTAVATIFSKIISDLSYSFIDNILLPVINIDMDNDGKSDIENIKNKIFKFRGIHLKIGLFMIEILKFIIILFILFLLSKYK